MEQTIDISELMRDAGIDHQGKIAINENMSGLEPEPKDDWLYVGLLSIRDVAKRKMDVASMACIGSGNGIETIAALKVFPALREIIVTDIVEDILELIRRNIEENMPAESRRVAISYVAGRDCEPVLKPVDLIYGNLPLIMVEDDGSLGTNRATTTLTDAGNYMPLQEGKDDFLYTYSLLSQLGFLLSAKAKLRDGGSIITLIGGRVPYEAIDQTFKRAGLAYKELYCAFKRQSDSEFLKEYADYETKHKAEFLFFDYAKAAAILKKQLKVEAPDVIQGYNGHQLKEMLAGVSLNANEAYNLAKQQQPIGHIAFAFEATKQ